MEKGDACKFVTRLLQMCRRKRFGFWIRLEESFQDLLEEEMGSVKEGYRDDPEILVYESCRLLKEEH